MTTSGKCKVEVAVEIEGEGWEGKFDDAPVGLIIDYLGSLGSLDGPSKKQALTSSRPRKRCIRPLQKSLHQALKRVHQASSLYFPPPTFFL